jgi:hypothetical protein
MLGGRQKNPSCTLFEDHYLIFIVAKNQLGAISRAKSEAKKVWDATDVHVDRIQEVGEADGYEIKLVKK